MGPQTQITHFSHPFPLPSSPLQDNIYRMDSVASALSCASAGFFAFHLWVAVRYRLYHRCGD